jgi:hypothetical protein
VYGWEGPSFTRMVKLSKGNALFWGFLARFSAKLKVGLFVLVILKPLVEVLYSCTLDNSLHIDYTCLTHV